ncbi:hypothetical protein DI005_01390 [Prauserella sp. PE36]|uniref:VOC family protein n=1 Tax=Prauserella endophytica TaxID=1592324 RepID=A0ABY2S1K4_9PSEU|nr:MULTISPECIES: VOC family protein [Prauserella]PXY25021.1 hypothetical protein BAY59_23590 [Prauserella coralliicola]RBM23829.1 hypothetical protein DI005_01390 [Prauserella sp. PE36]TKG69098.1 VOC family protein [Prauserella endophytica]
MATRLAHLVVDARQPSLLAGFWSGLLGWEVVPEDGADVEGAVAVRAPEPDGCQLSLVFVPAPGPKTAKNRVHLDLASAGRERQRSIVDDAVARGATTADVGQGAVPWVVLADPEGNEFCVLEPREEYADTGALAAVVVDVREPAALGGFWSSVSGWDVVRRHPQFTSLREPGCRGPWLELLRNADAERTGTRWRLAVAVEGDAPAGELPGARLTDPEGNEIAVVTRG